MLNTINFNLQCDMHAYLKKKSTKIILYIYKFTCKMFEEIAAAITAHYIMITRMYYKFRYNDLMKYRRDEKTA